MAPLAKSFNSTFFFEDLINVRFPHVISLEDMLLVRAFAETVRSVTCKSTCVLIGEAIHVERKKKQRSTGWFYLADYVFFL